MLWEDSGWTRGLAVARAYHAQHGHLRPPASYTDAGVHLVS